jgi:hypothetical protein
MCYWRRIVMPQISATEPLAQMLRSIALQERTGILRIAQLGERHMGRGELYFEKGHLIRAYCGQETGGTAVRQISAWKHITCSFHSVSKPLPVTTRILNPSRENIEEQSLAGLHLAPVPQTEDLHTAAASVLSTQRKRSKRHSADQPGPHIPALNEPITDVIPATHMQLTPLQASSRRLPAAHKQRREASAAPHTSRTICPAEQELPPPLLTPRPVSLAEEQILPGRNAIFKACAMVATTRAIEGMERRERIVFILLDGRRTIQDIARLIHQPESEVEHILVHLTRSGYTQYIQG